MQKPGQNGICCNRHGLRLGQEIQDSTANKKGRWRKPPAFLLSVESLIPSPGPGGADQRTGDRKQKTDICVATRFLIGRAEPAFGFHV